MSADAVAPKKIGILVVAYNAASTLAGVLDRIPDDFRQKIHSIFVNDDHSQDSTYLVGVGYSQTSDLPIVMHRHPENLGYGGNQKSGYQMAVDAGLDIVVLLHGDGQYAPECLPALVAPLERGECDAVFGSRTMIKGAARAGGMPLYKYVGNRILTKVENTLLGMDLSEFHSGYRAYSVDALKSIAFAENSDGFDFDTQIIIQLHDAGRRITEIPIPTYYGDEISHVNGMKYAWDVTRDVLAYRLNKAGFGQGSTGAVADVYELKDDPDSSHGRLHALLSSRPPSTVLDLGCSAGFLASRLEALGHRVTGVDAGEAPGVRDRMTRFVTADLDDGLPSEVGDGYDIVLAADVLEHLRRPEQLLREVHDVLRPGGVAILCVPNFAHWYPRFRVVLGAFDYDQRGILDRTHLRFFTRRSIRRLVEQSGLRVRRQDSVGVPFEVVQGARSKGVGRWARAIERVLLAVWPTMFAYQLILEVEPAEPRGER
jgi:2-polyprenyl-3-methyl-5-hydroxy-6-metoxy-1,4-benzoquinol methylase